MWNAIRQLFQRSQSRPPLVPVPPPLSAPPTSEQSEAIRGNAALVRKTIADLSGTDVPPGRAGVVHLDGFIERTRDGLDDAGRERMGTICGCYLGEALAAEYGAVWVQAAEGLGVQFSEGNVAYPINKATKHWRDGAGDSVLSFFDVAGVLWAETTRRDERPAGT